MTDPMSGRPRVSIRQHRHRGWKRAAADGVSPITQADSEPTTHLQPKYGEIMFSYLTGELARPRQSDLLATAQRQRLVREVRNDRAGAIRQPGRIRHSAAAVLMATARRLEPVRLNLEPQAAGARSELHGAASPC
jgi:hypothetical protein